MREMLFYMSDTFEQEPERDGKGLENKGLWPNLSIILLEYTTH